MPIGALLIVRYLSPNNNLNSIADSRGNLYTGQISPGGAGNLIEIYTSVLTTALVAGDTITITTFAGTIAIANFSYAISDYGWTTRDRAISPNAFAIAGADWSSDPSAATTQAEELLVGICSGDTPSNSSVATNGNVEELDFSCANTAARFVTEYQILSSTGTYVISGTWSTSTPLGKACAITFKTTPPPPPGPGVTTHNWKAFPKTMMRGL